MKRSHIAGNTASLMGLLLALPLVCQNVAQGQANKSSRDSQTPEEREAYAIRAALNRDTRTPEQIEADALRYQQGTLSLADGDKYKAAGKTREAIRKYQQAIAAIPNPTFSNGDAYVHLGDAYLSLNQYKEAAAAYDKLWYRGHPQDPLYFCVGGSFRPATLLKYAYVLQRIGRFSDALAVYQLAINDSEYNQEQNGIRPSDAHIRLDKTNIDSSDFDAAFNYSMGAALEEHDGTHALPYLLEATRRRPYLAIAHYYLGKAMRLALPSPELTEAKKQTDYRAEFEKAARMGSGALKAEAESMSKF